MKVFKFGGASVNDISRIQHLPPIISFWNNEKIIVIVSAMGKTTNALEKVVQAFYDGKKEDALQLFDELKKKHITTAKYLLVTHYLACESKLKDFFTEVEWLLHDQPVRSYDYYYDQIVCIGELLSTTIISAYLNEMGVYNKWMDVRDMFRTNDDFRNAAIDWEFSNKAVKNAITKEWLQTNIIVTQGFIGATDENESTTLGREGSDYTAAVFANMLDAEEVTIWKDVESVMNADPKKFADAIAIPELNYRETLEMAYYGAQVIHPKTIKPLQNKKIPLFVKSFLNPELPGTLVHDNPIKDLPPIIVLKEKQVMLKVTTTDFSFMGDHEAGHLYQLFESLHIKPNLTQIGAISFMCVMDDWREKIEKLALEASSFLNVEVIKQIELLTIRHYTKQSIDDLTKNKTILLLQQTPEVIQVVMSS